MKNLVSLSLMSLSACAIPSQPEVVYPNHPDPKLRADMRFQFEGQWYSGAAVLPRRTSSTITFDIPKDTYLFLINTCSREEPYFNPDTSKGFTFTYVPVMWLENMKSCVLLGTAVTKAGLYYRSVIDFTNSIGRDLPAQLACNGQVTKPLGAGFCQSRAGLTQRIQFDEETVWSARPECAPPREDSSSPKGWVYEIDLSTGFCGYDFINKDRKIFRLSTLGYTSILNVFPPKGN
jgi:hypothetical protein